MSIGTMLFNPFTGKPRHPSDIESDPKGVLVWDGEEPLKPAQPAKPLTDEKILEILCIHVDDEDSDVEDWRHEINDARAVITEFCKINGIKGQS